MKKGFTLIELLVVIAIIGILAAIIFPVFARAKGAAYKSSDISNLNSIRSALLLYKADQGAYPPALLGYVSNYVDGSGQVVVPANLLAGALYPKRIDSLEVLRPALDRPTGANFDSLVTNAVWPNNLVGNGTDGSLQRYGPSDGAVISCYDTANDLSGPNGYYNISGYDAAEVPCIGTGSAGCYASANNNDGAVASNGVPGYRNETHYALFWSRYAVAVDPCRPQTGAGTGSSLDDPRQLGYSDPPDTTVITWDTFFRDPLVNGSVPETKGDVVLFLSGQARPYDSTLVSTQSWKVTP